MPAVASMHEVKVQLGPEEYGSVEAVANQRGQSVDDTLHFLIEQGLRYRVTQYCAGEITEEELNAYAASGVFDWLADKPEHIVYDTSDITSDEIAAMAVAGGSFDWLLDEPDLYDETCGEPIR
jgi:hypothetical protein